jgi:hypothetical protein|tara:strand:+ start:3516 stop:3626 length:111 start_codon:yes stop_codon:yes gene_type:complete
MEQEVLLIFGEAGMALTDFSGVVVTLDQRTRDEWEE